MLFSLFPRLTSFYTTREGGVSEGTYASFNQSPYCGDHPEHYMHNRQTLCDTLGICPDRLIIPFQTHGKKLLIIDDNFLHVPHSDREKLLQGVDGLITQLPGVCIGITTADCVPLTLYDSRQEAIAVLHAGWRGTCKRIAGEAINALSEQFGTRPRDIYATIGPSISQANYQVGEELVEIFKEAGFPAAQLFKCQNGNFHLDLWEANRWLLTSHGVPARQIETTGLCTYAHPDRFFSARRLGIRSGRMLSGAMLS